MNARLNSLGNLFATLASNTPQTAAIGAPHRADLTFRALFELMEMTHIQLRQLGIDRGDRVMLFAPTNSPETATLSLAIAASATCITINPHLSDSELNYALAQLNPKIILAFPSQFTRLVSIVERSSIPLFKVVVDLVQPAGTYQLEITPPTDLSYAIDDWATSADIALIVMTSGSTGEPKFVPMSHEAICSACAQSGQLLQLSQDDICLNLLAFFHTHGSVTNFLLPLSSGGKVVFYRDFNAEYFLDWLIESRATWYSANPTIHLAILKVIAQNPQRVKGHSLRFIRSGSSVLSPQIITELEQQLAVPLVQGYGMSEVPLFTSTPFPPVAGKRSFIKICESAKIAIMDEEGNSLPNGTVGEIFTTGKNIMSGYINNPQANANTFRDGWFRTGDLGWLDDEDYLHLVGRLKEVINRGGNKVSPQEVDNALMQFPEVEEVGTFAVAHSRLGEDVVAAVVLKSGANITEQSLRALLFEHLTDFKIPSQILFVDNIPKGKTGKIQRNILAAQFADRLQFTYTTPRNELEVKIARLFAQILNLDKIGIYDNFFLLGGDSLIGTQIISRICQTFAIDIPIRVLFELPTVADFAQFIGTCMDAIEQQPNLEYEQGQL
jgi:acyl-CoA synthetase (AMP-forming)/AMP-acid ligase II/acyl carrier protein